MIIIKIVCLVISLKKSDKWDGPCLAGQSVYQIDNTTLTASAPVQAALCLLRDLRRINDEKSAVSSE